MTREEAQKEKRTLSAIMTGGWSYIINDDGDALRMTMKGYGSCTPASVLQEMIDNLTPKEFEELWNKCRNTKDTID